MEVAGEGIIGGEKTHTPESEADRLTIEIFQDGFEYVGGVEFKAVGGDICCEMTVP